MSRGIRGCRAHGRGREVTPIAGMPRVREPATFNSLQSTRSAFNNAPRSRVANSASRLSSRARHRSNATSFSGFEHCGRSHPGTPTAPNSPHPAGSAGEISEEALSFSLSVSVVSLSGGDRARLRQTRSELDGDEFARVPACVNAYATRSSR